MAATAARLAGPAVRPSSCRADRRCAASAHASDRQAPQRQACVDRRALLGAAAALAAVGGWAQPAAAVQGLTAGRLPGVTGPDAEGYLTYTRPEGKSGGHGVGWTEIQRYSFKVPQSWEETPVSIADLGGTEIDLRYGSPDEGSLQVVVAPVMRFKEVGFNANVTLPDLAPSPENLIAGFAPELYGSPLQEGDVLDVRVEERDGLPYYFYELTKHRLVGATATGNRLYMIALRCNSLQWRRAGSRLKVICDSFHVPPRADGA